MAEADAEKGGAAPVGEYLKGVRESRGLELDEASRVTKIGKSYLVALEEGAFDKLPSAAYIKGFLRLYAGYLGLSGDDVVAMYERSLPAAARQPVESRPERPVEIMERAKLGRPGRWVIPALLLALVIVAAIFFSDGEEKQLPQAPPPPQPAPAPPKAAAVLPPRSSAAPAPSAAAPADTGPLAIPPAVTKPGGIVLRLRFNRDSWLSITIDDSISQRYELKAGDVIEWKGTKAFTVDVGDGGAVEGEFNGRALKALGEPGKPAHVELKGP